MTSGWGDTLTPEMRVDLAQLQQQRPWCSVVKIVQLAAIWAAAGTLAVMTDSWWVRVPCYVVIGFVLHGFGVITHEGAHGALFRGGLVDRVVGFFAGLPEFFPCSCYRATHLLHHRYENSAKDPDSLEANFANPVLRTLVFYTWYVVGMPLYIVSLAVTGPFRAEGWREKTACAVEVVAMVAIYVGLFTWAARVGFTDVLVYGWLLAVPVGIAIANVRGLAEHTQLPSGDPLTATRSTISNPWVTFFFCGQNFHLEHHMVPEVPWYNLPKLHRLLRPVHERHRSSICRGYAGQLALAWRYGPLRSLSYDPRDHRAILEPK